MVTEIADNDCGFDPIGCETGRGLPGTRQRAQAMGAQLDIVSEPSGAGTRWVLSLPVGVA